MLLLCAKHHVSHLRFYPSLLTPWLGRDCSHFTDEITKAERLSDPPEVPQAVGLSWEMFLVSEEFFLHATWEGLERNWPDFNNKGV